MLVAGLKLLVSALLKSLPQLATVVMFLTFIFSLFGVLGVQIWSGSLHSRCRLTEFPVQIPSTEVDTFFMRSTQYFDPVHADHAAAVTYIDRVLTDRSLYPWCGADVSGTPLPLDSDTWTFSSSPWQQSRDCVWPIDESDTKLCTQGSFGSHTCATDRWCGSNYDAYGNERFSSDRVMRSATFLPEFLFGYAGFDWIFPAFLTIFECITLESWADIMYMVRTGVHCHVHVSLRVVGWLGSCTCDACCQVQDSSGALVASLYFIILILFGSFLILNLTLAVIWGHLKAMQVCFLPGAVCVRHVLELRLTLFFPGVVLPERCGNHKTAPRGCATCKARAPAATASTSTGWQQRQLTQQVIQRA